jgi:hypothetical protein
MQPCGRIQALCAAQCKEDTSFISSTKVEQLQLSEHVRRGWIQLNILNIPTPNKSQMTWLRLVNADKIQHDIAIGQRVSAVPPNKDDAEPQFQDQDYLDLDDGSEFSRVAFGAPGSPPGSKSSVC